ncbi:transposase [Marinagarivorans algicola]|nr:transposase [Marinagarivorans algicola]
MTKKRPVFSAEFKCEAAKLVIDKNYNIHKACEARGVSESAMRCWVSS